MNLLRKLTSSLLVGVMVGAGAWIGSAQGPLTNALNLGVRTDASGYLITTAVGYTAPDGPLTALGNIRLRSDANGYLLTTFNGVQTLTGNLLFSPDDTYDIGVNGATRPKTVWVGTGGISAVGTIASSNGSLSATNGGVTINAAGAYAFSTRVNLKSGADKLFSIVDTALATGMEISMGTPTLGTCTGGSLVSGSHNFGGEVTGNTSGSCVITFGAPAFTNTPFCVLNDETTLTAIRISARSASSITVTGAVSGDAFQFICLGRIGT